MPMFYIGKTNTEKISNGYRGSVSSKQYKQIWLQELKENPHLFTTTIIKQFTKKIESSDYEEFLLRHFNAHRNPMYINKNIGGVSFNLDESIQNKTHHFFDSKFQTEINNKRVADGTHNFCNSEFQREMGKRAKSKPGAIEKISAATVKRNKETIANRTHNFMTQEAKDRAKKNAVYKNNRDNVKKLREILLYLKNIGIKPNVTSIGLRSDEWIDAHIEILLKQYPQIQLP